MKESAARLRAAYAAWNNPPSDGLPEGASIVLEAADHIETLEARIATLSAEKEAFKVALELFARHLRGSSIVSQNGYSIHISERDYAKIVAPLASREASR